MVGVINSLIYYFAKQELITMPKIYRYKVFTDQFVKGQLVSSIQMDALLTTTELFEYLGIREIKLPRTLSVFRNNLHSFFMSAAEMDWEEVEAKMSFIPKDFKDKRNYIGYSVALAGSK